MEKNEYIEYVENFIKIATTISILALCIGFLQLEAFYLLFHINISNYIGVSEIVTTSFSFLISYLIHLTISYFIMKKWFIIFEKQNMHSSEETKIKGFYLNAVLIISIIVTIPLLLEPFINLHYYVIIVVNFLAQIGLINLIIYFVAKHVVYKKKTNFLRKINTHRISIMIFIIYLISFPLTFFYAYGQKIFEMAYWKENVQTKIFLMDNSTIITNDSIKYLGKTDKFYFIYNRKSGLSSIYPAEEIKKITIKNLQISHQPKKLDH